MAKQVVILDAGSQFCGQIDRVVHELEVASDILPLSTPASKLSQYTAIIISGGPDSVNEANSKDCDPAIFSLGKPILGICYGMQLIAKHLGGSVGDSGLREDGMAVTNFANNSLFKSINGKQTVWMSHGDSVHDLPTNFEISGSHEGFISAVSNTDQRIHALQFHPEVHNTPCGKQIISNFLFNVAKLTKDFSAKDRLTSAQEEIKEVVGNKHVIMYLSGGVDSTVMAMLIAKTLEDPSKIHAYHIVTAL
jgi:GMP synthase (glutamine-hydrolysing)